MQVAFDVKWEGLAHVVRRDTLKLPDSVRLPRPEEVAAALAEPWMAVAREAYQQRVSDLVDQVQIGPDGGGTLIINMGEDTVVDAGAVVGLRIAGLPMGYVLYDDTGAIDQRLSNGLHILHLALLASGDLQAMAQGRVVNVAETLIVGFEAVHRIWKSVCPNKLREADLQHPLAALIEGWLRYQKPRPENAHVLLTDGKSRLARSINHHKTAALATWHDAEAVFVEVDAEAMASFPPQAPMRAIERSRRRSQVQMMLPLPGQELATDLRLLWSHSFDRVGLDRRKTTGRDAFFLLTLSGAMIDRVIVPVADVGAWLRGEFSADDLSKTYYQQRRDRGWEALVWATQRVRLPDGTPMPLLEMNQLGVEEGKIYSADSVELRPWGWARWKAQHGQIPGWRLTGALAHSGLRYDKSGILARVIVSMEDWLAQYGSAYLNPQIRAKITLPYTKVLARAGLVFDMDDPVQNNRTRQQWWSVKYMLQERGYCLPKKDWGRAEAPAGDTIEIVGFGQGTVTFRASARWCEAERRANLVRGDAVFTGVRFRDLFPRSGERQS